MTRTNYRTIVLCMGRCIAAIGQRRMQIPLSRNTRDRTPRHLVWNTLRICREVEPSDGLLADSHLPKTLQDRHGLRRFRHIFIVPHDSPSKKHTFSNSQRHPQCAHPLNPSCPPSHARMPITLVLARIELPKRPHHETVTLRERALGLPQSRQPKRGPL